jgi:glycosyltransferase involved in cell wall biosynthesis/O-antigen/teichoic acid export membrane protein
VEATFRYPNELAAYLLIVLPLAFAFLLKARRTIVRVALSLGFGTGSMLLFLTYTRGAIVAGVLGIVLLLFILVDRRIALTAGAIVIVGFVALLLHGGVSGARLASIFDTSSAGYSDRSIAWHWALQIFLHHPLFGIGLGNLAVLPNRPFYGNPAAGIRATDAENMYLNIAAQLGIFGAICFVAALILAIKRAWQGFIHSAHPLDQAWNAGVLSALAGIMVYGMVDPILVSGQVTGLLCVIIGLCGISSRAQKSAENAQTYPETLLPEVTLMTSERLSGLVSRRLVFLVNGQGLGGANRHSLNIAQRLQYLGANALVVVPPGALAGGEASRMGLPVRELEMGTNIGRWKGILGTLSLLNVVAMRRSLNTIRRLDREEPTTFICPYPREQLLTAWLTLRQRTRAIWVVHTPFHYLIHKLLIQPVWIRASRRADAVVAVSRGFSEELHREGMPATRLYPIPNAIEVSNPQNDNRDQVACTPYLIGAAGRLVEGKGIQYLIDSLPGIVQRFPNAHLVIAGTGRYEKKLRAQVQRLGLDNYVTFAGHIQDMHRFYQSLHVFVLPSLEEVLPTVVLEAAAAETAVVATNVGATAEAILNGVTGLLVKPADVAGLQRAILQLLNNPEKAIAFGRAGHEFVARQFDIQSASKAFYTLAQQIEQPAISTPLTQPGDVRGEAQADEELWTTQGSLVAASQRRGLLGRSSIVLISKLTTAFATACWTIIAARALLPSAYGDLALVAAIVDLGAYLSDAGIQSAATSELASATRKEGRVLLGSAIYLKLLLGVIGTGLILVVVFTLPFGGSVDQLMLVLGPSLLFASFNTLTLVFRGRTTLIYLLFVSLTTAVVGIGTTLVAYLQHGDVLAFAKAQLVTAVVSSALTVAIVLWRFKPSLRPHPRQIVHLLKTAVPLGFSSALVVMYYRLDVPIIGLLASSVQVALYTNAYRFLDVLALIPASLEAIALPQMASLRRRGLAEIAAYCQRYLEIAVILGSLLGMLLSFTAPYLLTLLYGARYGAATPILHVLAWAGAATFLTNMLSPIAIVLHRSRAMIVIAATGLVVNVVLNLALIPHYGALAAAYATLLTEVVVILGFGWVGVRALGWRIQLLLPLGAVVATGVCEVLIHALAAQAAWVLLPWPIASVALILGWGLSFAPFWLIHSLRAQRRRTDVLAVTAEPQRNGIGLRASNSIWLLGGLAPSAVWTWLADRRQPPSAAEADPPPGGLRQERHDTPTSSQASAPDHRRSMQ